jgi:hypothetical protein
MHGLESIIGDWRVAAFVAAALVAFIWAAAGRVRWNLACNASGDPAMRIPERSWSYDAHDLQAFANAARHVRIGRQSALDFYVHNILKRSDICFAIALAAVTAFVCYEIAVAPPRCVLFNWAALPLGAMAILYGIADVAEDLKLASILKHPQSIDRADAAAANMLTRIKITALILSVIGVAIYLVISGAEMGAEKLLGRRAVARA